VETISAGPIF